MEFFILIGAIIGFFYLSGRITRLEQQLKQLQGGQTSVQSQQPAQDQPAAESGSHTEPGPIMQQPHEQAAIPATTTESMPPAEPNPLWMWLKEDFFVKLGALLLLIAFGWFVSYAFANNWIGPAGRIVLGLLAGIGFMGLGLWRIEKFRHQGGIFTVLGSTTVLLTIFAAREIYDFFTPGSALGIMFLSVVFVAFVAVRYESQRLAVAGLILGAIAPLLTNTDPNVVGIFSYLMVLVVGSLWVMSRIGAVALPLTAFLIVAFYGFPYVIGTMSDADTSIAILFSFVFTAIFFASNMVSILTRTDDDARKVQVILALGTGLYLTSWIFFAVDPVWQTIMYIAWALVFAFGAFVVYMRTNERAPFYIYSAVSLGLLAVATANELNGPALTIAYTVEITALLIAASRLFKDQQITNRLAGLFVGPIILSIPHLASSSWREGFLHGDFFAVAVLMFCLWVSAVILYERRPDEAGAEKDAVVPLTIVGGLYALTLVWLITHSIMSDDAATTISLFIYTVVGITLYMLGQRQDQSVLRLGGGLLVGLVVGRLLLVEVWAMPLAARIITFFVIGILLISTAFMGKLKRQQHVEE